MKQWHTTYKDVPDLLTQLCAGRITRAQGDRLVHATADFAVNALRWLQYRRGWSYGRMGLALQDVAFDTVAELLVDGSDGPCSRLRAFLLAGSSDSQVSLLSRFKAIVIRTVHQNIVRMFADYDPTRARLLANLRRHASTSPHIEVHDTCHGRMYAHADPAIARLHLGTASEDRLAGVIFAVPHTGSPVVNGLEACFRALAPDPDVRCAVYEHDIIRLVVDRMSRDLESSGITLPDQLSSMQEEEIHRVIDAALGEAWAWIAHKYVRSGRLSETDAAAMISACRAALLDAAFSAEQDHFVYMKECLPGLTYERYRSEYRNRTEYIHRRIFSSVGARLLNLERTAPPPAALQNIG